MANEVEDEGPIPNELALLAFEIFKTRTANLPVKAISAKRQGLDAFRIATVFVEAQAMISDGIVEDEADNRHLADICAPNMPADAPINVVAKVHTDRRGQVTEGDPKTVKRLNDWFKANPSPRENDEDAQKTYVESFKRAFPRYRWWELPELNLARQIVPAHAK